jgi:hypothetical protein
MREILKYSPDQISQLGQLGAFGTDQDAWQHHDHPDAESAL